MVRIINYFLETLSWSTESYIYKTSISAYSILSQNFLCKIDEFNIH